MPITAGGPTGPPPAGRSRGGGGHATATIASPAAPAVVHGFSVKASARIARRGSTLRPALLLGPSRTLGSFTRRHAGPDRLSCTVALAARGRRLLRARRSLSVRLAVTVTAADGTRDTGTRAVQLKAP